MFTKTLDDYIAGRYSKVYTSDHDMIDIVRMIERGPHIVRNLHADDDSADVGMHMFGGDYSFEEFYRAYETYGLAMESVRFYFADIPVSLSVYDDGTVSMLSTDEMIDLSDIIGE